MKIVLELDLAEDTTFEEIKEKVQDAVDYSFNCVCFDVLDITELKDEQK